MNEHASYAAVKKMYINASQKTVYFKASLFDMFLLDEESRITKHE